MRVNRVEKAAKPHTCGRCGKEIKKGDPYAWAKGRYTGKSVRCSDDKCRFRASDLTGSDKLSRTFQAQEGLEDAIAGFSDDDDVDGLQQACTDAADSLREVAQEYRDSADAIRENFSESSTADECEEKADGLESWADEIEDAGNNLENFEPSEFEALIDCEGCSEPTAKHEGDGDYCCSRSECEHTFKVDPKDENDNTREDWATTQRELVEEAANNCPL